MPPRGWTLALLLLSGCRASPPPLGPTAPAVLHLRLLDRTTLEPRQGQLQLWRLDVPSEPGWTAGDVRVGEFHVPPAGLAIPDLAPGRYRAASAAHAGSAPDLPAFELDSAGSEVALEVETPHAREVWVELVDVHGQSFASAELLPGARKGSLRLPAWLHPRRQILEDGTTLDVSYGGAIHSTTAHRSWRKLTRDAHGLPLGRESEDGELHRTTRSFQLRVPDHGTVNVTLPFDGSEDLRYRMLLVEKDSLEGRFTTPDGQAVDLNHVHILTPLEPEVLPRPPQWWLDVPIEVSVTAPGFRRLVLEQRLRDGPFPARVLEPGR